MNRPIRRTSVVALVMFALLLFNCTWFMVFTAGGLDQRADNRRLRDEEFGQNRGAILVGNTPVAITEPVKDRFRFQRRYPQATLYAPITGWYAFDYGTSGLERTYNGQLAGTDDSLLVRRILDIVTNRVPTGATVQTTIDARAQEIAYRALTGTSAIGAKKGAVVAMDAKTGAVLALVSTPSYDPNALASHNIGPNGTAGKAWTDLNADTGKPLSNRAAREIYPPGSTFKLVTAAAALENGASADRLWDAPERLKLPNTETYLPNQSSCGGAKVTLEQALKVSCNTAFANVGIELGADKLRTQAERFGFGARQLADLNGVISRFPDDPDPAQTALSAIGQFDVAASPLQMTMVTAGIANDGVVMKPHLVSGIRGADLAVISQTRPERLSEAMSPTNARILQQWMQTVVTSGTGSNGRIAGVEVGGKTGTANTTPERPPYAWYTSYARKGDRTIAVTVFIEEANIDRNDISGGRLAAPIAKSVLEALL